MDWDRLLKGEILVEGVKNYEGIPGVRATFVVAAPREAIWEVLVDYDNFPEFFRGIERIHVIDENMSGAHVEFWVDAVLADLHYVLYREYVKPGYKLRWRRVSGDLKRIEGSWTISDTPDRKFQLIIYDSYVEIGVKVATWFIQLGAKRRAHEMAEQLREWIQQHGRY